MNNLKIVKSNGPSQSTSIDAKYPWAITSTLKKVTELSQLADNWDGYGALSPTKEALIGAVELALELFEEGTPLPDVFPVPNGNIQLEWSCFGLDLEIEVISNRRLIACFDDLASSESWERSFTFELTKLRAVIEELTLRNQAPMRMHVVNG